MRVAGPSRRRGRRNGDGARRSGNDAHARSSPSCSAARSPRWSPRTTRRRAPRPKAPVLVRPGAARPGRPPASAAPAEADERRDRNRSAANLRVPGGALDAPSSPQCARISRPRWISTRRLHSRRGTKGPERRPLDVASHRLIVGRAFRRERGRRHARARGTDRPTASRRHSQEDALSPAREADRERRPRPDAVPRTGMELQVGDTERGRRSSSSSTNSNANASVSGSTSG